MSSVKLNAQDTEQDIMNKSVQVVPSQRQIWWQELDFTAFIHFGVNTFTDREWGDGTEDASIFNPTNLDAEGMVLALKDAEMKAVTLTCKHHDGFCLWPSKYTEYSVKNSPWKDGKGDVVREFADACKKHGLKFGIYLSPWDRHDERYGNSPAYNQYYLDQLRELLTEYGEIYDLWLDGACAEGPNGKVQEYDWRGMFSLMRELQPNATITGVAPDARWCGNEAGICRESEWSVVPIVGTEEGGPEESEQTAYYITRHNVGPTSLCRNEDLGSREMLKKHAQNEDRMYWYPSQVDLSIRPGWFYHAHQDEEVRALKMLIHTYLNSVGGNAQLLLNVPPDKTGQFHQNDIQRLKEIGDFIRNTFGTNFVKSTEKVTDMEYILNCESKEADLLVLCEDIAQSQRVEAFDIYAQTENDWEKVYTGTTIGFKKMVVINRQKYSRLKLVVTQTRAVPMLQNFGLHLMPNINDEVDMVRGKDDKVEIELPLGGVVSVVANGVTTTKEFGISNKEFKITNYSTEEIEQYELYKIFSSDEQQHAKMPYVPGEYPTIEIDMEQAYNLKGINYMPVTRGYDANLNISSFSLYISVDGTHYETIFENKELSNIYHNPILFKFPFDEVKDARYIRFQINNSLGKEKDKNRIAIGQIHMIHVTTHS